MHAIVELADSKPILESLLIGHFQSECAVKLPLLQTRLASNIHRSICPAGRHELLEHEGLENHPEIPAYALSELRLKYKKPLRLQDSFLITVALEYTGRAKVDFRQRIIRLDEHPDKDSVCFSGGFRDAVRCSCCPPSVHTV
jgi:hypothetical protein